jgi:hypothetical protein
MYSVTGFVEKNGDSLPRDLSHAMYRCNNFLLKAMFPEGIQQSTLPLQKKQTFTSSWLMDMMTVDFFSADLVIIQDHISFFSRSVYLSVRLKA